MLFHYHFKYCFALVNIARIDLRLKIKPFIPVAMKGIQETKSNIGLEKEGWRGAKVSKY